MDSIHKQTKNFHPDTAKIASLRRYLHENPELRFEEANTSALVAKMLRGYGISVEEGIGGYGVVGTLRKGDSARAIALRADMDALPLQELNTF